MVFFIFLASAAGAAHGHQNGGGAVNGNTDKTPETGTGADGKNGNSMMVHRNTNYDEIFNVRVVCAGGDA